MSTRGLAADRYDEDQGGWLGLVTFVAACVGVGVGLWWFTGPPTMFTSVPDWAYIREVLGSSELRDRDVITVTTGIAWLVIGYVLLSVVLRFLLGAAFAVTGGAAWVRAALSVTSPLTIPIVRRMVDAALAGTIVVSATFHTPSATFASSSAMTGVVEARVPTELVSSQSLPTSPTPAAALAVQEAPTSYTVVRGDSLWRIAERFLGDGFRWVDIWRLNQQQTMADGRRLVDPNLIYPGWVLELPDDAITEAEPNPGGPDPEREDELDASTTPTSTVEPEPTAWPPTPDPTPVAPTTAPTLVPATGAPPEESGSAGDDGDTRGPVVPDIPTGGTGVAAAAVAFGATGAVMFLVVRRLRGSGSSHGDRARRGRRGDAGRVLAMTVALTSGLDELDFGESRILLARETEHYVEFTIQCPHGDEEALVAARHELGRILGCAFNGTVAGPGTVLLKLSRMSHLATAIFAADREHRPLVLPVGATDDGIYYLSLTTLGSVLIMGDRLETRELATSWLTTLETLHEDANVAVVADHSAREHLGEVLDRVPDLGGTSGPALTLTSFVEVLEQKLVAGNPEANRNATVAFVGPVEDGAAMASELDGVLREGPQHALFTVALADGADAASVGQTFGAVITGSADEHGPVMTLALSGVGAFQLEPVVLRRLVAVRPPPRIDDVDSDFPEPPGNRSWDDAISGDIVPTDEGQPTEEELERDDAWSISAEVSPEPAVLAATNGAHAVLEHAMSTGRAGGEEAMDRQASLPFEATDGEAWEGPRFRIRMFGAFRIATDDDEITTWAIHKARELLAYLLVHGGTPVLRDTVSETLWPETNRKQAYHQLSNAAYTLRRTIAQALGNLEAQSLVILNQRYQLRPGLFRVDIDTFDAHLNRADSLQGHDALIEYQRACSLYTAPLLIHEAWDWAGPYREDYRSRFVAAMKRAGALALTLRDPKLAIDFYNRILQQEPIDEEAVQGLMRSHGALGDTTGVKVAYRRLVEALQETLDDDAVEPLPQTVGVYREVLGRDGD